LSFHLTEKIEDAAVVLVSAAVGSLASVLPGQGSDDKTAPCVICACDGDGEEDPRGSGNVYVTLRIICKGFGVQNADGTGTQADPSLATRAVVDLAFGAIQIDTLEADLSAATNDLTVFPASSVMQSPTKTTDEHGVWIDELSVRLYCCGSALAA
jgi:hypothetical protein